jgi:hypothetical protein
MIPARDYVPGLSLFYSVTDPACFNSKMIKEKIRVNFQEPPVLLLALL